MKVVETYYLRCRNNDTFREIYDDDEWQDTFTVRIEFYDNGKIAESRVSLDHPPKSWWGTPYEWALDFVEQLEYYEPEKVLLEEDLILEML